MLNRGIGIVIICMIGTCLSCYVETQPIIGDIVREVGEDLVINCTIDESCDTNASYVYWTINGSKRIDGKFVKPLSRLTAQLNISSVTIENAGNYQCWPNSANYISNNTNMVKIGYKPLTDLSFNCISHNLEKLNCSWSEKAGFNENDKTKWLLKYKHGQIWESCSLEYTKNNSCVIKDKGTYTAGYPTTLCNLTFILSGENRLGTDSKFLTLEHYKIVELNPPKNIVRKKSNSTSATFSWEKPSSEPIGFCDSNRPVIIYFIRYESKWDSIQQEIRTESTEYTITGLIPYTDYTVKLSASLQFKDHLNKRSDEVEIAFQTNQTVPEVWTALTTGSFQVLDKEKIILYFKTLQPHQFNGPNLFYKLYANQSTFKVENTSKSYAEIKVNENDNYIIHVSAINSVGETQSDQSLLISNKSTDIAKPIVKDTINYENGTYLISWISSDTNLTYTVFWCKTENENQDDKRKYIHCNDSGVNWVDVECEERLCRREISVGDAANGYHFAVASKMDELSNGMVWSNCTIPESRRDIPTLELRIVETLSSAATIAWVLPCKSKITTIKELIIYYKTKDFPEENNKIPYNNNDKGEHSLKNLVSGTTYTVQMSVLTSRGKEKRSEAISFETPTEHDMLAYIIPTGILFAIICVSTIAFFVYKKYFKEKLRIIHSIMDHIPCGIINPTDPKSVQYSPARRDSESKFTIQLPQTNLDSSISLNTSNTSGFISDSLESILSPPHYNSNNSDTDEQNTNNQAQEENQTQPECITQQPQRTQYVNAIPQTPNDNQEKQQPKKGGYITFESITNNKNIQPACANTGYVQAVNLDISVASDPKPTVSNIVSSPYVLVKDITSI